MKETNNSKRNPGGQPGNQNARTHGFQHDKPMGNKKGLTAFVRRKKKPPGNGIFSAGSCPPSIVCAKAFHCRVRDGNGWCHLALITRRLFRC